MIIHILASTFSNNLHDPKFMICTILTYTAMAFV